MSMWLQLSVDRHCAKVNEGERKRRKREKGMDTRAGRDGICSSCLAGVVEREAMDVRGLKRVRKSRTRG